MLRRLIKIFLLLALAPMLSCGHFQSPPYTSPEFTSQSEFSTANEFYSSDKVLQTPSARAPNEIFSLQWPVKEINITRGFLKSGQRYHLGLDLRGRKGDLILAAHSGVVIYAGSGFRGYGRMIILEYDKTWATLYGHMHRLLVKTGQEIKAGEVIGLMGRTGRATGVHLHFEVMQDKEPTDPLPLLNKTMR